jgi:hypothetical protein
MLKIYVDTGGNTKQLRPLHAAGKILLVSADIDSHPFTPKRGVEVKSTLETWEKTKGTWGEQQGTWDDEDNASEIYPDLVKLVGRNKDSRHLDTAYRNGCRVFLTSDKGDISDRREAIAQLTGIQVFHNDEMGELLALCGAGSRNA